MMLGDKVPAIEAEKIGMVYKIFAEENFAQESLLIATTLAQLPTKGLAFTKHALNNSLTNNLETQLIVEDTWQQKAAATLDYNEGVAAFLEKRKPVFTGK